MEHVRAKPCPRRLGLRLFTTVTVSFRIFYVFVVLEVGTRRIVHWNVTEYPSEPWILQQFRMILPGDQPHRFVIHDRDTVFSAAVDQLLSDAQLTVLKTPIRSPQAKDYASYCTSLV
jgi:putative transposase